MSAGVQKNQIRDLVGLKSAWGQLIAHDDSADQAALLLKPIIENLHLADEDATFKKNLKRAFLASFTEYKQALEKCPGYGYLLEAFEKFITEPVDALDLKIALENLKLNTRTKGQAEILTTIINNIELLKTDEEKDYFRLEFASNFETYAKLLKDAQLSRKFIAFISEPGGRSLESHYEGISAAVKVEAETNYLQQAKRLAIEIQNQHPKVRQALLSLEDEGVETDTKRQNLIMLIGVINAFKLFESVKLDYINKIKARLNKLPETCADLLIAGDTSTENWEKLINSLRKIGMGQPDQGWENELFNATSRAKQAAKAAAAEAQRAALEAERAAAQRAALVVTSETPAGVLPDSTNQAAAVDTTAAAQGVITPLNQEELAIQQYTNVKHDIKTDRTTPKTHTNANGVKTLGYVSGVLGLAALTVVAGAAVVVAAHVAIPALVVAATAILTAKAAVIMFGLACTALSYWTLAGTTTPKQATTFADKASEKRHTALELQSQNA